jgi:hypothetical protein
MLADVSLLGLCGVALLVIVGISWLVTLGQMAGRTDLDPATKTCWVIILCTLNIVGWLLYGVFGPGKPPGEDQAPPSRPPLEPPRPGGETHDSELAS